MHDEFIKPPGPKMLVCVSPADGIFFRINTENKWPIGVPIFKIDNIFLKHDSFLQVGNALDLDDYIIDQSKRAGDPVKILDHKYIDLILAAIDRSHSISPADKAKIKKALGTR